MKISELIALLEKCKQEYGDVEIVVYNYRADSVEGVRGVLDLQNQYTNSTVLEIY